MTASVEVGMMVPNEILSAPFERRQQFLERAGNAGIDHLAVGDHVSFHAGVGFDGLVQATALLSAQNRLPVTVAVYLLALRHPVVVARSLASIHELAPGRLTLGVGVGGEDRAEIEACGVDPSTRGRRTDEALSIVRRLATGERVDHHGRHFALRDAHILPAIRPATPIVIGGRSPAALDRAARWGDGWLGIWVTPERFARSVEHVAEAASAHGRADVAWRHQLNVWCGLDDDRDVARTRVASVMEVLYATPFHRFERYVPTGRPADVAEHLLGLAASGCRHFHLIAPDVEPLRALDHVADTAARLRAGLGRRPQGSLRPAGRA
jgi:alkanesulfonate monooxygenase SsuD/methylene tetrahydromethanopterin reductase-like flavin-dependent oxidoreductase (luciferase family)